MFRLLQFVSELRLLIDSIIGSFTSLVWCFLLLLLVSGIFALFLVQQVTVALVDQKLESGRVLKGTSAGSSAVDENLLEDFRSVQRAILTLFKTASGGMDWGLVHEPLLQYAGVGTATIYLMYIVFTNIAAWNIITSIFLEKVTSLAQPDLDTQMIQKHRKDMADAEELKKLTKLADVNESGKLSLDEFVDFMDDSKFRSFFELRDLDIKDAEMFFHMLCEVTGSEEVDISTFVTSCMRMRGLASSLDLHALSFELKVLHISQRRFVDSFHAEMENLRSLLGGHPPQGEQAARCTHGNEFNDQSGACSRV